MNLTNFSQYLKLNLDSKNSQKTYFWQLQKFFRYFSEFNQENINAYLAQRFDEEIKKSTFNLIINALKCYAKFLKVNIELPTHKKEETPFTEVITNSELEDEILPYFVELFQDSEYRKLIVRTFFTTGLRPQELINLKVKHVHLDKKCFLITNTKSKRFRFIPIHKNLLDDIIKLCKDKEKDNSLFNISKAYIHYIFQQINCELMYKKKLHPYCLRHSFAHNSARSGVHMKMLKEIMGHSDIRITERYYQPTWEEIITNFNKCFKYKKRKEQ